MSIKIFRNVLGAAMLAMILFASTPAAMAQDEGGLNQGKLSFNAGVDFSTHYFFRGILQEDQGLVMQPYGDVTANIFEGEGAINTVDLVLGVWNSVHGGNPTEELNNDYHYELDWLVGASIGAFDSWSFGVMYTAYTSPADAFPTVQEIALSAALDDRVLLENLIGDTGLSLSPYVLFAFETRNGADGGFDNAPAGDEGVYLELGIEPSVTLVDSNDFPLTLSVPVTLGISLSDYYEKIIDNTAVGGTITAEDESFGFLDIGLVTSVPLGGVPNDYGTWDLSAGVHFLFLGDTTESLNNQDDFEVVGTLGISMSY